MRSVLVPAAIAASAVAAPALAQSVEIRVTATNLAPTNSITFAPLRVGFGNGTFDSFNINEPAGPAITSVAEGGSGSDWFPAFEAAEPAATLGTVVSDPAGPLLPGASASATFTIDTDTNQYFTFASMVVPSNDHFIGNDSPTQYRLFDDAGNLLINSIGQTADQIWDNGSEATDPANAAFLVGGVNDNRTPENGVVTFDFDGLSAFNGLETAAGYTFDSQLTSGLDVYRITFEVVPAPATAGMLGMAGLAATRRRRA